LESYKISMAKALWVKMQSQAKTLQQLIQITSYLKGTYGASTPTTWALHFWRRVKIGQLATPQLILF